MSTRSTIFSFSRSVLGLAVVLLAGAPAFGSSADVFRPVVRSDSVSLQTVKPLTRWQPSIFELLVTVGALAELLRPTSAVPMIEDRAALTKVLSDLGRFTVLSTARVDHTLNQIQVALGADGQRLLVSGRLRREQQVAQILARSRLVRTEDAPSPEFFRLAFQVPGGQATVAAVQLSPAINPFLQGLPSSTLQTLLKRLNEQ